MLAGRFTQLALHRRARVQSSVISRGQGYCTYPLDCRNQGLISRDDRGQRGLLKSGRSAEDLL